MTKPMTAREALEEALRLFKESGSFAEAFESIRALAASLPAEPSAEATPTVAEVEEFRREHHIPDDGKLEPWAIKENAILNYLCYRAATPLTLPASESKAQPAALRRLLRDYEAAYPHGRLGEQARALLLQPESNSELNAAGHPESTGADASAQVRPAPAAPAAALPEGWLAAYRRLSKEYDALCASEKCVVCGAGAIRLRFDGQTLFHDCMACGTTQAGDVVIRANVALAQSKVPEGWVAVPKEPTEAMQDALINTLSDECGCDPVESYRAMLAAAPKGNEEEKKP